jgi:hypothetical protein
MLRIVFIFLMSPLILGAFEWKDVRSEYQFGYQFANGFEQNGITRSRPYFVAKFNYSQDCSEVKKEECKEEKEREKEACLNDYEVSFRFWADFARVHINKNVDIRSLYFQRTGSKWTFKLGFQEVAWGETFGLYIADFINPRDLTDPFFNELSYVRIPVCMVNAQYFNEPWSLQIIATPIPMNNLLPAKGDPFDVFPKPFEDSDVLRPEVFKIDRWGQDIEYGGRLGYLFESGWDVAWFYYRHWNRFPVYQIILGKNGVDLKPVLRRINSIGASFSKAFEAIVLRGDAVLNFRTPWTVHQFGNVKRRNVAQMILGLDYSTENNLVWGLQYHWDYWEEGDLHSASFRVIKDFGKNLQYHAEFFAYKGLNNHDLWIQPRFGWDVNDSLTISLRVDVFGGKVGKGAPNVGFIGPYRHKERVFLWMTYAF